MFSQSNRMREMFANQFQGEGVNTVYRRDSRAAPVRVSPQERDDFITAFRRFTIGAEWAMSIGVIALVGVIVLLAFQSDGEIPQLVTYVSLALLIAAFVGANFWAWYAPARALNGRVPAGKALTPEDVKRQAFASLSYGKLATGAGAVLIALLALAGRVDIWHGWGRLWLAFVGAVGFLIVVQAVRKWRFESTSKRP